MGRKRKPGTPDATMQLDALVDDFEEIAPPDLMNVHGVSAPPPPLPPKKAGMSAWLVGVIVVLLAGGAAAGIGLALRAMRPPAATPATASAPEAAAPEATAAPTEPEAIEAAPAEPEEGHVQMEAFVFDDEPAPAEETPEPSE